MAEQMRVRDAAGKAGAIVSGPEWSLSRILPTASAGATLSVPTTPPSMASLLKDQLAEVQAELHQLRRQEDTRPSDTHVEAVELMEKSCGMHVQEAATRLRDAREAAQRAELQAALAHAAGLVHLSSMFHKHQTACHLCHTIFVGRRSRGYCVGGQGAPVYSRGGRAGADGNLPAGPHQGPRR